jgi:hypothetical protein
VLTPAQLAERRHTRRTLPSLTQQYQHYLLHRIESYKNSLTRDELLALGNDAAQELHSGAEAQFLLTEMLMVEMVDALIMKRLRLPSYRKWRDQFAKLRQAQREPVHWGVDPESALVPLLPRLEPTDHVLLVGAGVQAEAFLLAAHECEVTFLDEDMALMDQLDARMSGEALGGQFFAYVASLGTWLPPFDRELDLVVIDAGTLSGLAHANRQALLISLRNLTREGGVHVLLPGGSSSAPEGYLSHYPDWDREPHPTRRKATRSRGVMLTRPVTPA